MTINVTIWHSRDEKNLTVDSIIEGQNLQTVTPLPIEVQDKTALEDYIISSLRPIMYRIAEILANQLQSSQ